MWSKALMTWYGPHSDDVSKSGLRVMTNPDASNQTLLSLRILLKAELRVILNLIGSKRQDSLFNIQEGINEWLSNISEISKQLLIMSQRIFQKFPFQNSMMNQIDKSKRKWVIKWNTVTDHGKNRNINGRWLDPMTWHNDTGKLAKLRGASPNEDIRSSWNIFTILQICGRLEFSGKISKPQRYLISQYFCHWNLWRWPPLCEISDLHKIWHL